MSAAIAAVCNEIDRLTKQAEIITEEIATRIADSQFEDMDWLMARLDDRAQVLDQMSGLVDLWKRTATPITPSPSSPALGRQKDEWRESFAQRMQRICAVDGAITERLIRLKGQWTKEYRSLFLSPAAGNYGLLPDISAKLYDRQG
ncbi:hypothetical protein GTO89_08340 [Heliobacterium gestii]|uniref:Flagellar protein FlgN n=1 Tax=Heliomicrobium gestii TaxID=2699 RepID=A0A845LHW3_HELGE|nr:hypothetical protein [Heliomicrobium gestii]MBM7866677.1 hypothetical protein [Heliomicrobium gestii]MZP43043.1 hypothetical protein [Heliomicrobium gestii]